MLDRLQSSIAGIRDQLVDGWFAEGFLGPRTDLGWPSGVQEDDDHRWTWTDQVPPVPAADAPDRPVVVRVEHAIIRRPRR